MKQSWRPALSLQDRDIEFLRAAEEFRLLSTPQFLRLFPAESQAAIYRRLRTLFDHGYLDRIKGDPSAPMVYALGTRGGELLVERGFLKDVSDLSKKNRKIQNRYVAHQEMIANFRIALVLATRDRPDLELSFFEREGVELHDRVTAAVDGRTHKIPVYPDGYFSLRFPLRPEGKNRAHFFSRRTGRP